MSIAVWNFLLDLASNLDMLVLKCFWTGVAISLWTILNRVIINDDSSSSAKDWTNLIIFNNVLRYCKYSVNMCKHGRHVTVIKLISNNMLCYVKATTIIIIRHFYFHLTVNYTSDISYKTSQYSTTYLKRRCTLLSRLLTEIPISIAN